MCKYIFFLFQQQLKKIYSYIYFSGGQLDKRKFLW